MTNRFRSAFGASSQGSKPSPCSKEAGARTKNGALLRAAEADGFEVFLTADQSLQFQQNLTGTKLRIVVFAAPSNRIEHIRPLLPQAIAALQEMLPGELRVIRSAG